jgi:hypothetical protein
MRINNYMVKRDSKQLSEETGVVQVANFLELVIEGTVEVV